MTRRKFLYSSTLGLFVPSVFGIPPITRLRTMPVRKAVASAATESVKETLGQDGTEPSMFGTATYYASAISFTSSADESYLITKCIVELKKTLAPTGDITCVLCADNGSNLPGTELSESPDTLGMATLSTSFAAKTFTLTTGTRTISIATKYWLAFWASTNDSTNYVSICFDSSGDHRTARTLGARGSPSWAAQDSTSTATLIVYGI